MALASSPARTDARPIRYVCMPGSPFTGSTLLGVLLNEHPAIASIGAATGLIWKVDLSTYACSCGKLFRECEFWRHIESRTAALGYPVDVFQTNFWNTHLRLTHRRVPNALLVRSLGSDPLNAVRDAVVDRIPAVRHAVQTAGWNTWSLASAVLERTGKQVFVDTARDHQRPKYLMRHPLLDIKVIHLVRDPRGNTASIMKHGGVDSRTAARQWTHYNVEAARVRRHFSQDSWMTLRYEELCADPQAVLDRVATFLGLEPARLNPDPRDSNRHIIGNPMRLKALSEIREDVSWQTHLSGADLEAVARIGGSASRSLGYDWPQAGVHASETARPLPTVSA